MNRVFLDAVDGERGELSRDEEHHLVSVLRTKPGDLFEGLVGGDFRYRCRLMEDESGYYAELLERVGYQDESPLKLELAPALIKREKFELTIQKATELGVSSIVPLVTSRTEIRLDEKREEKKLERWNKILRESVKQCGRNRVPSLSRARNLGEYLESAGGRPVLVFDENVTNRLDDVLDSLREDGELAVLIGPEGGWSDEDRLVMKRCPGLIRAGFGPRVLRAETAAVAALSIIQYELGDLSC